MEYAKQLQLSSLCEPVKVEVFFISTHQLNVGLLQGPQLTHCGGMYFRGSAC